MECLLCKSKNMERLNISYKYDSSSFKELFPCLEVVRCNNCGLIECDIDNSESVNDKLMKYYKKDYRGNLIPPNIEDETSVLYQRGKGIADIIKKHISKTEFTVFEKGCGYGYNLMHIKKIFPNAECYTDEVDEGTRNYLDKLEIKKDKKNKYDIVIASHVLEHLTNPHETIEDFLSMLNDDGLLYIELPNSMNIAEPHISFWNADTFLWYYNNYLIDKFELLECYTCGYPYYFQKFKKVKSIYYRFRKRIIPSYKVVNKKMKNGVYLRILLKKHIRSDLSMG